MVSVVVVEAEVVEFSEVVGSGAKPSASEYSVEADREVPQAGRIASPARARMDWAERVMLMAVLLGRGEAWTCRRRRTIGGSGLRG
jgi:hypothetical protein